MEDQLIVGLIEFLQRFNGGIEFNLISYEFGGRLMDEFVLIEVREHWCVQRSYHASFDEIIMKLIVICVCMCMFDGEGGQAIEGDREKQPETSNK